MGGGIYDGEGGREADAGVASGAAVGVGGGGEGLFSHVLSAKQRFKLRRQLEAYKYGSGRDFVNNTTSDL